MIKWKKEFFERGLIIILMAIILCNEIYAETGTISIIHIVKYITYHMIFI